MPQDNASKRRKIIRAEAPFILSEGKRVSSEKTFDGVARLLQGRKNIVVLVGAGISVSCGIPDFRSRDSGLYSTLDTQKLGLSCPEDLFDLQFFSDEPGPFYSFAKNLYFPRGEDIKVEPSDSHKLLALLEQRKMLLRVYSQNIDGLENMAGVSNKKIVYAHGSLRWATCTRCHRKVSSDELMPSIKKGVVARCQVEKKSRRNSNSSNGTSSNTASPREPLHRLSKRQRTSSTGSDNYNSNVCGGVFKPGVTFFGETLNDSVRRSLEADRDKVDALIVIGTSLSVAPISKVIEYMPPGIPRILINRTVVQPSTRTSESIEDPDEEHDFREGYVFDSYLLGFCDDVTRCLAKKLFKEDAPATPIEKKWREKSTGRLLTKVLKGEDNEYDAEDWEMLTIPAERVLLFPGAQASKNDSTDELTYREIAHCDGCSKRIHGTIHKCTVCFDYDLCTACFPKLSRTHYDGKHVFNEESQV